MMKIKCKIPNPLPTNKFLDWSKLKAFADYKMKINVTGRGIESPYFHPYCYAIFYQNSLGK